MRVHASVESPAKLIGDLRISFDELIQLSHSHANLQRPLPVGIGFVMDFYEQRRTRI